MLIFSELLELMSAGSEDNLAIRRIPANGCEIVRESVEIEERLAGHKMRSRR